MLQITKKEVFLFIYFWGKKEENKPQDKTKIYVHKSERSQNKKLGSGRDFFFFGDFCFFFLVSSDFIFGGSVWIKKERRSAERRVDDLYFARVAQKEREREKREKNALSIPFL